MSLGKEFKDFINKGNVLDLAVAVVIGAAFTKIVSAFVNDFIMPIVGAIQPSSDWRTWTLAHLKIGDFLGAIVDFLIVAAVVFLVVVKLMGRFRATPSTKKCGECLEEIPLAARRCKACTAVVTAFVLLLCGARAFADDPKFEYKAPPEKPPEKATVYKANAAFGLVGAYGNSKSLGFSGNGLFSLKHYSNQLEISGQTAYAIAGSSRYGKGGPITDYSTATQFWLLKGRYDRYFGERQTVFASFQSSGDKPAGYVYRIEPQVGYSRLFFKSPHQTFRGEGGYDYTLEHRPFSQPGPNDIEYHSLRLYAFYENKFTHYAAFSEGLEAIWALNDLESVRVNSLTSLSSTISKSVSLKLNYTVRFNNTPPKRPVGLLDPITMLPPPANDTTLDKVDMILEILLAVTFL